MPVRTHQKQAEARYNVTTDFPHLGLHSAAVNGNIGLVQYALSHGQPINSVLDGVLPLHAACSGGNDLVVKLLIEQGADVNASRLPRRYSDRNRDASAPIVGSSGSTPLHFAAANGHASVIRTLLLHGAHADRADKHNVTPEMVARDNGHAETAEVLREWLANKDKDLREREGLAMRDRALSTDSESLEHSVRKRLHVKRSIDNALHSIKPSLHSLADSHSGGVSADGLPRRYASSGEPPPSPGDFDLEFDDPLIHPLGKRQACGRRPRSAGNGADPSSESSSQRGTSSTRKLGSKYSLRNLFKKAADTPSTPDSPYTNSSMPSASTSASPSPGGRGSIPLPGTPPHTALSSSPLESSPLANRHRPRVASETSVQNQGPLIDMHNTMGEHSRARSRSRHGDSALAVDEGEGDSPSTPPSRPGILLSHGRSSSSGQSQQNASFRALRFEASSSSSLSAKARNGAAKVLRGFSPSREVQKSSSATSLNKSRSIAEVITVPDSAPATVVDFCDSAIDGDDEEYGEVIQRPSKTHLKELQMEGRPRGLSLASSNSSLSPIISPDICDSNTASRGTEFPFSISRPPPTDVLDEQLLTVPCPSSPRSAVHAEIRNRGDSISSLSTDASGGSQHPEMSWSNSTVGTTSTIENESTSTPATSQLALSRPAIASPGSAPRDGLVMPSTSPSEKKDAPFVDPPHLSHGIQRSHTPVNIDIQSISSHAQAEALVQRAQDSILAMSAKSGEDAKDPGRSPLSAKLAAYGESLALERRLKEVELGKAGGDGAETVLHPRSSSSTQEPRQSSSPRIRDIRVLEAPKRSPNPSRSRIRQPRRPNTSDSVSSNKPTSLFTLERPSHHSSRSTSFVETHQSPNAPPAINIIESPIILNPPHTAPTLQHSVPLARSRTPDPSSDDLAPPHVPLERSTTAPTVDNFMDSIPSSNHLPAARHMASANKLTRMGFSGPAVTVSAPLKSPENKSRFGLKSFFKGKTP